MDRQKRRPEDTMQIIPTRTSRSLGGRVRLAVAWLALAACNGASAQVTTYEGCEDASGRPVASEIDATLPAVAASRIEQGHAVIRYNPQALPQLKPDTRLFFFAHECARHTLGQAVGAARSPRSAQQADCRAIVSLVRSGLISQGEGVKEIQADLVFAPEDWALLPGPPRSFDLESCFISALRLPGGAAPAANQPEWNGCIRVCGDRLLHCQRDCRDGACQTRCVSNYEGCEDACNTRFAR